MDKALENLVLGTEGVTLSGKRTESKIPQNGIN